MRRSISINVKVIFKFSPFSHSFEKQYFEISIPIIKVSLTDIKMLWNSLIILELRTHWHFSHDMLNIVDLHISFEISFGLHALIDGLQIRWDFKQAILKWSRFEFSPQFKPTLTGLVSSNSRLTPPGLIGSCDPSLFWCREWLYQKTYFALIDRTTGGWKDWILCDFSVAEKLLTHTSFPHKQH